MNKKLLKRTNALLFGLVFACALLLSVLPSQVAYADGDFCEYCGHASRYHKVAGSSLRITSDRHGYMVECDTCGRGSACERIRWNDCKQHGFAYSANGAQFIAKCNKPKCSSPDLTYTLTLSVSSQDGSVSVGTSDEVKAWKDAGFTVPTEVSFETADGQALSSAPSEGGSYVAKVSYEGATAQVPFEIAKASVEEENTASEDPVEEVAPESEETPEEATPAEEEDAALTGSVISDGQSGIIIVVLVIAVAAVVVLVVAKKKQKKEN